MGLKEIQSTEIARLANHSNETSIWAKSHDHGIRNMVPSLLDMAMRNSRSKGDQIGDFDCHPAGTHSRRARGHLPEKTVLLQRHKEMI
jgi:hypothetical protein